MAELDSAFGVIAVVILVVAVIFVLDDTFSHSWKPSKPIPADVIRYASAPPMIRNVRQNQNTTKPEYITPQVTEEPTHSVPTWRTQGKRDVDEEPKNHQNVFPPIHWQVATKDIDEPWHGSEHARNLMPGRNPQYEVPLLSYSFPSQGRSQQRARHSTPPVGAGMLSVGSFVTPGRDVIHTEQSLSTYRDFMSFTTDM